MPDPDRLIAELRRLALVAAESPPRGMRCRVCGSRWPFAAPRGPKLEKHNEDCVLAGAES